MSLASINKHKIILASQSPRRRSLLSELGIDYTLAELEDIDESYPDTLPVEEVPVFLSELKAGFYKNKLTSNEILITADTIVILEGAILGKPKDYTDALDILKKLSGNKHTVVTGVSLTSTQKTESFSSTTDVYFKHLPEDDIIFYLDNYKPFDKAGAYGIQEWIGYVAIEKIEGSFYNVMGLPTQKLFQKLISFINEMD